jgi:hypothetical protein
MRTIISKKFTDALFQEPSKQCELLLLTGCQKGPKWAKNAPNGRYHAPDFSFKNAKIRLNIIIINTLRAACVFIAFTFPKPSENEVQSFFDARESFLPYKSSAGVLLESWRFNGVMNFRENDADRSNYVFSMFSTALYALYKDIEAVY